MKFLILLFFFCACQKSIPLNHFSGTAFNIPYHIQIGHQLTDMEKQTICQAIQDIFLLVDKTFNHWNPNSEVSHFNACIDDFTATEELLTLIQLSKTLSTITHNRFDPTLGVLTTALKSQQPIEGSSGIQHLQINGSRLSKTAPIKIDFDGISKGYAIDLLIQKLADLKHENIYVEWGGEMRVLGKHPLDRPWRVLLRGIDETQIDLFDCAIATSGDALQHYGPLTHIIDPKTQQALPIANHSITVKAPSAALADALATALMLCTPEEIKELKKTLPDIEVWNEDGIF